LPGELPLFADLVRAGCLRDGGDPQAARRTLERVAQSAPAGTFAGARAREALAWLDLEAGDGSSLLPARAAGARNGVLSRVELGWLDIGLAIDRWRRGDRDGAAAALAAAQIDPTARAVARSLAGRPADGEPPDPRELTPLPALELPGWTQNGDFGLLRRDLERARRASAEAGVDLWLATYPWPGLRSELRRTLAGFAGQHPGVGLLDFEAPIAAAMASGVPREQLFIADGHPTSAGYALLGRAVAEALAPQ
jgi:hypothetical protein